MDLVATEIVPTFEIAETPIPGDPLAALREQKASQSQDWRSLLDQHIEAALADRPSRSWIPQHGSSLYTILAPQTIPFDMLLMGLLHDLNEDSLP